jgi:hypothetical protein
MKTFSWKKAGFTLAILGILFGNIAGIKALATEDGDNPGVTVTDNAPDGVLVGYRPEPGRLKIGEHLEVYGGWVGASFSHLVIEYQYVMCCNKTLRAMDGCTGFKICNN